MSLENRSNQYGAVFGDWHIQRLLGTGSGGKTAVFEVYRDNKGWIEYNALKAISLIEEYGDPADFSPYRRNEYSTMAQNHREKAEREVRLMEQLRGKTNIVDYLDHQFFEWRDETGFGVDLLIRMEKLSDLRNELKNGRVFSEEEIVRVGRDVCQALIICHKKNILHRDIKPENIFFNSDGDYKLGDFGVSRIMNETTSTLVNTGVGTAAYCAPEQLTGAYDKRVDIYSLGLVLYELANGNRLPFAQSGYVFQSEVQMRLSGAPFPALEGISSELAKIIMTACAFDPKDRYSTAEELLQALGNLESVNMQPEPDNTYATVGLFTKFQPDDSYKTMLAMETNQQVNLHNQINSQPAEHGQPVREMQETQKELPHTGVIYTKLPDRQNPNDKNQTKKKKPASSDKRKIILTIIAAALIVLAICISIPLILSGQDKSIESSTTESFATDANYASSEHDGMVNQIIDCGTCGDNLAWELDANGTLTISGTGSMTNFQDASMVPWSKHIKNIQSVVMNNGVASIGGHAFYNCNNLVNVSIPDSVTDIRGYAFSGAASLTTVCLPAYLTDMGGYVFTDCTSLTNIVIPEGMTHIPAFTFRNCTNLEQIQIPASVTSIHREAFDKCTNLKQLNYGATGAEWNRITVKEGNTCLSNARIAYENYTGNPGQLIIASGDCGQQLTWTINERGTLVVSGTGKMTNFEDETEIPWRNYADKIFVVIICDGVTGIGGHAFCNCSNLVSVQIPDSVNDIRGFAFSGCTSLAFVDLPNSITQMGGYVFYNCTSLKHIALPEGITSIPGYTFSCCTALESVSIHANMKEIRGDAFRGCDALKTIYYGADAVSWAQIKIDRGNDPLFSAEFQYNS